MYYYVILYYTILYYLYIYMCVCIYRLLLAFLRWDASWEADGALDAAPGLRLWWSEVTSATFWQTQLLTTMVAGAKIKMKQDEASVKSRAAFALWKRTSDFIRLRWKRSPKSSDHLTPFLSARLAFPSRIISHHALHGTPLASLAGSTWWTYASENGIVRCQGNYNN